MRRAKRQRDDENEPALIDMPEVWFAALERGRRSGDDETVRAATENLLRLGYAVSFVAEARR